MGSTASKAASKAPKRQYPTRIPNLSSHPPTQHQPPADPPPPPSPSTHPPPLATETRTAAINADASDPNLATNLRTLGPVTPSSTMSNSSTFSAFPTPPPSTTTTTTANPSSQPTQPQTRAQPYNQNPALLLLSARTRLAEAAEQEIALARTGQEVQGGRRFLDVGTIREAVLMRDAGVEGGEVERRLGLGRGVVGMLGRVGAEGVGRKDGGDSGIYE